MSHEASDPRSFQEFVVGFDPATPPSNWIGWHAPGFQNSDDGQGQVEYGVYALEPQDAAIALDNTSGPRQYEATFWLYSPHEMSGSSVIDEFIETLRTGNSTWTFTLGQSPSLPQADNNGLFYQLLTTTAWATS